MLLVCAALPLLLLTTTCSPVRYDQRQTGGVNLQVRLQNIEVLALLDDYWYDGSGDYDYSDYGVPPPVEGPGTGSNVSSAKPPTDSPTTGVVPVDNNKPANDDVASAKPPAGSLSSNVSPVDNVSSAKPPASSLNSDVSPVDNAASAKPPAGSSLNSDVTPADNAASSSVTTKPPPKRHCNHGFYKDRRGRCRKVQSSLGLPFGLRLRRPHRTRPD